MFGVIFKYLPLIVLFYTTGVSADLSQNEDVQSFISEMKIKHGFDTEELSNIFGDIAVSRSVLEAVSRPAEALPWYKYRSIFLRPDRIRLGVRFIEENRELLERAEKEYGVPTEIITAIIGVETRYGSHKGSYKVIESLSTLAFFYPKRGRFFRNELEQFLLLAREQGLDPREARGSYAGAMGIPQFISSSYRNYAVDFDNDGRINIWNSIADAVGSVANYFKLHGWKRGKQITVPASVKGDKYIQVLDRELKPGRLSEYGIYPQQPLRDGEKVKLMEFDLGGGKEFWLGLDNFYVITRYNHSALYAMAAYQLSRAINDEYADKVADTKH